VAVHFRKPPEPDRMIHWTCTQSGTAGVLDPDTMHVVERYQPEKHGRPACDFHGDMVEVSARFPSHSLRGVTIPFAG
jgi:hypothetical protein